MNQLNFYSTLTIIALSGLVIIVSAVYRKAVHSIYQLPSRSTPGLIRKILTVNEIVQILLFILILALFFLKIIAG